jgi:hypothetical protein
MVEGVSEHFSWLKRPPAIASAALHSPTWDYGIVFVLWFGTLPKHWAEGVAFIAALPWQYTQVFKKKSPPSVVHMTFIPNMFTYSKKKIFVL